MLSQLYIQNIAIIKEATIHLTAGFNVFTGETGAGKSMLIGAINAVLGERTSKEIVRTGESSATVSALFTHCSPKLVETLGEMGFATDGDELLLSREITQDGRTTCRIDGRPATAAMLRTLAGELLNIHGQHDNHQLITPDKHIGFIDSYGDLSQPIAEYQGHFSELAALKKRMDALAMDEGEKMRRVDLLDYQIGEIEDAALEVGEEEELSAQRRLIRNREKIATALQGAAELLQGGEELPGLREQLEALCAEVAAAAQYIQELEPAAARLEEMGYELQEYASTIADNLEGLEYDPQQAEYVESRLSLIHQLKKKYGSSVEEILAFLETARAELTSIQSSGEELARLEREYDRQLQHTTKLAGQLHTLRQKAAEGFVKAVQQELGFLDMPGVRLTVAFAEKKLSANGADDLELLISTNPGEPPKPLAKIASGGELSRIMLAIKNVMADKDGVDTLIFDEVDSGVSGRAAQKIGRKLRQVSHNRQVICVTHLAQVAAFGDNHLLIEKQVEGGRTFTRVRTLGREERIEELARITSGDSITPTALQNARELLETSR